MTSAHKHSEGPWRYSYSKKYFNYQIHTDTKPAGQNDWIAITKCETLSGDEHEANARLISAAPDLLAALNGLLKACARVDEDENCSTLVAAIYDGAKDKARAAIAKAKGQ